MIGLRFRSLWQSHRAVCPHLSLEEMGEGASPSISLCREAVEAEEVLGCAQNGCGIILRVRLWALGSAFDVPLGKPRRDRQHRNANAQAVPLEVAAILRRDVVRLWHT